MTLTIELDAELWELAERMARSNGTTALEAVRRQMAIILRTCHVVRAGHARAVYQLQGVVYLSTHVELPKVLTEELRQWMINGTKNPLQPNDLRLGIAAPDAIAV